MGNYVVTGDEELRLRKQWEREVLPKACQDREIFDLLRGVFQKVSEGHPFETSVKKAPQKRNLAEERCAWFQRWYNELGFEIEVPVPTIGGKAVSNREFDRRAKLGKSLFYRPATSEVSYEAFMIAVGQEDHWTVNDEAEREKVGWELTEQGYWFWAEVRDSCPRLKTSWNTLTKKITLLSLEEYVIVWYAHKAETSEMLDQATWTWLRTRYRTNSGSGALDAYGSSGRVGVVLGNGPVCLSVDYDNGGGRAAEVVK
ncbi:MAG: hypothetical protein Q8P30_00130 [Candidatus Uhrbacteria bacterium]|nr:hypothetical protein [Candidatus Uhrbacteria bacterium]